MRAEDYTAAGGGLIEMIDEMNPSGAKTLHDVFVVHDLFPDVQWLPVVLKSQIHDIDRADDARAEAARASKECFHGVHF